MQRRKAGLAVSLGFLAAMMPLVAFAQGAPGLSPQFIQPKGYFDFTLMPGQTATNTVQATNLEKTTETYEIYTVDAATDVTGGVSLNNLGIKKVGVGNWITLASVDGVQPAGAIERITLAPGKSQEIKFTVRVPLGTPPEDAVGGIVGQNVKNQGPSPGGQFNITLVPRVGLAVVIHIPPLTNNVYKFSVGNAKLTVANQRQQVLTIPLDNVGNRLIKPEFAFDVYNVGSNNKTTEQATGKPVDSYDHQLDTFLAFTTVQFPYSLPNQQVLQPDCYEVISNVYLDVPTNPLGTAPTPGPNGVANTTGRQLIGHGDSTFCVTGAQTQLPLSKANYKSPLPTWVLPAVIGVVVLLLILLGLLILAMLRRRHCCKTCRKIKGCPCKSNKTCVCDDDCSEDCPEERQKAAQALRDQRKAAKAKATKEIVPEA